MGWRTFRNLRILEYAQGGDIESGGTCPSSALKAAISKLKEDDRENVKNTLIFLTDGEPSYNL